MYYFKAAMLRSIIVFLGLLFLSNFANGQTYKLSDTKFLVGNVYRVTNCVCFELNSSVLRPESFLYLDSIADFLKLNNQLEIEVGVHVDARASDKSSLRFDQRRAESIVNYLISKGIESDRLSAKGYWKTKPIIDEKTIENMDISKSENAHAINRRIEFKVTMVR
jgi:outer membrane protein OmpA-like peptidoglycan-associated protein